MRDGLDVLKETCQRANVRLSVQCRPDGTTMLGFCTGKHVWDWFRLYPDGDLFFDHSYSMNTGRSNSGVINGVRIREKLEKKLGVPFSITI